MSHVLITGGSGFFGGILKRRLQHEGNTVVNIDLVQDEDTHPGLTSIQGDLRDSALVQNIFSHHRFDAIFHIAAQLAHGARLDERLLWTSNVDATRQLAAAAAVSHVRPFVFVSSNCLWAADLGHPVEEERDTPSPIEIYGKSKLAAEQCLQEFHDELNVVILRCPTIVDAGRLGLLAILFEFMDDGKTVWVVGKGDNRYQFIYADDLASAAILGASFGGSGLFHVGSDDVKTMREVYESVICATGGRSEVRSLPKGPTIAAMKLAHKLGVSPLGSYHYRMITENFIFDTTRAKSELGWSPTITNDEMLLRAYEYYSKNRNEIMRRSNVSAHRKPASMGVIRLLKWIS